MSEFVSIHNHSNHSLLDSCAKIPDMVKRAKELGQKAIAITDHGTIAGIIQFYEECKERGIKPLIGCEFYVSKFDANIKDDTNRKHNHLIVIAKNLDGYKDLIHLNNMAAHHFYYNPRVDFDIIKPISEKGNLIASSACIDGVIAENLFVDSKIAFSTYLEEECKDQLREDWFEHGCKLANMWNDIFPGGFYIELQDEGMAAQKVIKECLRKISKETGIITICTSDPHFVYPEDNVAHEIIICSNTRKTLAEREDARQNGEDILFSDNSRYYIKSYEDMKENFTDEEIANTVMVADSIEEFEIELSKPKLPIYPVPDGHDSVDEFIKYNCLSRMKELGIDNKEYLDRYDFEYKIFSETKINGISLNNYFAILWDIIQEVYKLGSIPGVGRGSAAGCLTSYLLGITRLDPIEYDLSFQRFFNTGRLSEGRVSLPDIDLDVSTEIRGEIIKYLKKKWGENNVIQISTFGKLQPKAAIKEVFRARGISFDKANVLTKAFPDADIKHDDDASYTIEDALRVSSEFREAMEPYKAEVELAKRLEGVKKSRGIHAAGVLISSEDVNSYLPIVYDSKSESMVCAFEMGDAEKLCVKVDVLGLKLLTVFDLCTKKINDNNATPVELSKNIVLKKEKLEIEDNPEKNVDNGEKDMTEEKPINFPKAVVDYFVKKGYNANSFKVKDGSYWYMFDKGDKEFNIALEYDCEKVFQDRRESIELFIGCSPVDDGNSFIFTIKKVDDDICSHAVYMLDVVDVKNENRKKYKRIGLLNNNKIEIRGTDGS